VPRNDRAKDGRPLFDYVFMFKVLILPTGYSRSDERTEYLIKDRLSFRHFLGRGVADAMPDVNTVWLFREALTKVTIDGKARHPCSAMSVRPWVTRNLYCGDLQALSDALRGNRERSTRRDSRREEK
jgi:hypothetical protein